MSDENNKDESSKKDLPPLVSNRTELEAKRRKRRIAGWSAVLALLVAGGIGVSKYGHPFMENHRQLMAQFPGLQESVAAVGKRMDDTEEKLRAWTADRDGLTERLSTLEKRVNHNLQLARKQTQEMTSQIEQRLETAMNQRQGAMQTRVDQIESSQESERVRTARLEEQMAGLRREVQQQVAQVQQQTGRDLNNVGQRVARLDQRADHSEHEMNALSQKVDWQRVDFEVPKNSTRELLPGITLHVSRTDISHRRFDGWMWVLPEHRTVWVRSQGAQQPVVFYSKLDNRPHELVVTQVTKKAVIGYLLVPRNIPPDGTLTAGARNTAPSPSAQ